MELSTRTVGGRRAHVAIGLLATAFLFIAGLCAGFQTVRLVRLASFRWDSGCCEGEQANAALRFAHGGPIYVRPDKPPYTAFMYGPLFYGTLAGIDALARPKSFPQFVFLGRIFIFLCYLLIALFGWLLARRLGAGPRLAWAAPFLTLAGGAFNPVAASLRPDIPAILCCLIGIYILVAKEETAWERVAGAGFLMGLGFLFKQPYLAAPAASFLWFLSKRRYRLAAILTISALSPVVAVIGWLELHSEPVLYSLLLPRYTFYGVSSEIVTILSLVIGNPTSILLLAAALPGVLSVWRRRDQAGRLVLLYLALSTLFTLVTMAQVGAAAYYMAEMTVLLAAFAPLGLELSAEVMSKEPKTVRVAAVLALFAVTLPGLYIWRATYTWPHYGPLVAALRGHRIIVTSSYLAAQGKDPEMIDTWVNSLQEEAGIWSPAPVLKQIRAEEFDYIMFAVANPRHSSGTKPLVYRGIPWLSAPLMQGIKQNYREAGRCLWGAVAFYVPRQEPRGGQLAARIAPICGWPDHQTTSSAQIAGPSSVHGGQHPRPENSTAGYKAISPGRPGSTAHP